jgi:hypothetical protein
MRRAASSLALCAALFATNANAALTSSEEVVVRQYVAQAQTSNASRVRAVVARPDLSADESAEAMTHALVPTAVTDARVSFLRELVFGAGSQASRSVLAAAVTRGLVARADEVFSHNPSFDAPNEGNAELFRIYAFLSSIANAGTPTMRAHDAQAGIDSATYESSAKVLGDHLKRHAASLEPGTALSPIASRIRAQAMLAAYDMGADSPTRAIDGADRIGLDAARRALLLERGVLLLDSGKNPQALASAIALVRRFRASAFDRVEAIVIGGEGGLHARGAVLAVKEDLDSHAVAEGFPADEVGASTVSAPLSSLAGEIALAVSKSVLQSHGDLRLAVQRDAGTDAKRWLGATDASPESIAANALRMLVVDAPRTIDLAMARFLVNRPESAALVSDALGVLAASAGPDGVQSLVVGRGEGDGTSTPLPLTAVRLNPSGTVAGFTLANARWEIVRDTTGVVTGVRRDGQPLAFAMLAHARIPVAGGSGWTGGSLAMTALYGSPLVGIVSGSGGPRARIVAQGDLDVARIQAPGDDVSFDADVRAEGPFEILLRSESTAALGIGLRVAPGAPTRISLVNRSGLGVGGEHELASSVALSSVDHVHVEIRNGVIHALCTHRASPAQTAALEAPVPAHQAHGDAAVAVQKGSSVELDNVMVRATR